MQLTLRLNKTLALLLAVLSCSLLISLNGKTRFVTAHNNSPSIPFQDTLNPVSIWETMSHELNLQHHLDSPKVQHEIRKFLADKQEFHRVLNAANPYIYYIYQQTKKMNLPAELALIPVIESEFNPNDHSSVGALGLWQLMPATAKDLGVKISSGYDGRRNVVASTKAALSYFKGLGNLFKGNWHLAIAAYNCGEGRVLSAKKRAGSNSFWDLKLPAETKAYVPRLLAVAAIVKNPEKYGIQLPKIHNKPFFQEVPVKKAVSLGKIAKYFHISVDVLNALNPDYKQGAASINGAHVLLVPINKVTEVKEHLNSRNA